MLRPPALLLVLLAGVASATAPSASASATSTAADAPGLEGTAWVLAELPGQPLTGEHPATLRFEKERALGFDGCNRYSTPYTAQGAALELRAPGAATMMACPPPETKRAASFRAALAGTRSYRVEQGRLQLLTGDGQPLATFAPQPSELAGSAWRATAINNGRQAVVSLLADTTVTLEFAAAGAASGSAGCNTFRAAYVSEGTKLSFGPAVSTRMACARAEVMQQEQDFLKALATVATARFDGDRLELHTTDGAVAVQLTRRR